MKRKRILIGLLIVLAALFVLMTRPDTPSYKTMNAFLTVNEGTFSEVLSRFQTCYEPGMETILVKQDGEIESWGSAAPYNAGVDSDLMFYLNYLFESQKFTWIQAHYDAAGKVGLELVVTITKNQTVNRYALFYLEEEYAIGEKDTAGDTFHSAAIRAYEAKELRKADLPGWYYYSDTVTVS